MTRPEARRVAKKLAKAGYRFIRIVEEFDTGTMYVTAENRCNMHRVFTTVAEFDTEMR